MAVEEPEECLAKFSVHETVRDGIAAARDVCQQLNQANAGATDDRVHQFGWEKVPRIDYVQRCPAHEELEDYYKEHPDYLQHQRYSRLMDKWQAQSPVSGEHVSNWVSYYIKRAQHCLVYSGTTSVGSLKHGMINIPCGRD